MARSLDNPDQLTVSIVEQGARCIRDPVARLRFLKNREQTIARALQHKPKRAVWPWRALGAVGLCVPILVATVKLSSTKPAPEKPEPIHAPVAAVVASTLPRVWPVEQTTGYETFSNGLRIENRYQVATFPRADYRVFARTNLDAAKFEWRAGVAGIVYHTTESHMADFDPDDNQRLQNIGAGLLAYVARHRAYHFVIDRFGRVFRVVQESDVANHAGVSVWADQSGAYIHLNQSFLGIAFETQTDAGSDAPTATPAQIQSGRVLTEMLRGKYNIPATNCVTHAQVSVNGGNYRIGLHTDWAGNFPFAEMDLPDNYLQPLPSVWVFGFAHDQAFERSTGSRMEAGVLAAEDRLRQQAVALNIPVARLRGARQREFERIRARFFNGAVYSGE